MPPPLLKLTRISRSPFLWWTGQPVAGSTKKPALEPENAGVHPVGVEGVEAGQLAVPPGCCPETAWRQTFDCRNWKPCCASPLVSKRSEPKYRKFDALAPLPVW